MSIDLILLIISIVIPIIYLIVFMMKETKKKKKKRNYLYGFIVAIIIFIILFVIRLIALTYIPTNNKNEDEDMTTTTTEIVTEEVTTTKETTTKQTTTKEVTTTKKKVNYGNVLNPSGGTVVGTTSKGYEVRNINGIYYVDGYLIANKTYSLPSDFSPGMNSTVTAAANEMFAAAKAEKGFNLYNASGFRSYSSQKSIYNNYVNRDGKAKADTYSARPGYSEHQSGLAFDVCDRNGGACINSGFNNTEQAKWLSDNAYKYGFILRYVNGKTNETGYMYESWHFRYVGKDLAAKLYNNGNWITMEAYFGLTSSYDSKPIGS